ncbi:MAG: chemotaxis protein CheB [Ilyomonas sp.]
MEENTLTQVNKLLIAGGSSGSMEVILEFLPLLKRNLSIAIVIVLHRKNFSDSALIELFSSKTFLPVKEAEDKEIIKQSVIYVASADYHLLIEKNKTFSLDYSEKINYSRPSIDVSFESAADTFKENVVGLLLSGANADGADGLAAIKQCNGITAVQDPATASVPFMPKYAMERIKIDYILKPSQMADFINEI